VVVWEMLSAGLGTAVLSMVMMHRAFASEVVGHAVGSTPRHGGQMDREKL